jgi:hypothetical protein
MKSIVTTCAVLAIGLSAFACSPAGGGSSSGRVSIREACGADIQKLCSDVDRSEIRDCMKTHADQLSAGCKAAIAARMAARSGAPSAAPAPANQ